MTDDMNTTDDLDALFTAARQTRSEPSQALRLRVLEDAVQVQQDHVRPEPAVRAPGGAAVVSTGWIRQITAALGGWPGLGGLATACAAGVWIGFAPPSNWPDPANLLIEEQTSYDLFQNEDFATLLNVEDR